MSTQIATSQVHVTSGATAVELVAERIGRQVLQIFAPNISEMFIGADATVTDSTGYGTVSNLNLVGYEGALYGFVPAGQSSGNVLVYELF